VADEVERAGCAVRVVCQTARGPRCRGPRVEHTGSACGFESAIFALGAVRHEAATDVLIERWNKPARHELRQALVTALATNRSERALEFLLSRIAEEEDLWASAIAAALEKCRASERVLECVRAALEARRT